MVIRYAEETNNWMATRKYSISEEMYSDGRNGNKLYEPKTGHCVETEEEVMSVLEECI
jgi:hypothetical protein